MEDPLNEIEVYAAKQGIEFLLGQASKVVDRFRGSRSQEASEDPTGETELVSRIEDLEMLLRNARDDGSPSLLLTPEVHRAVSTLLALLQEATGTTNRPTSVSGALEIQDLAGYAAGVVVSLRNQRTATVEGSAVIERVHKDGRVVGADITIE